MTLESTDFTNRLSQLCEEYRQNNGFTQEDYTAYGVKRGLRNPDGTGVMAGLTRICNVHGFLVDDGVRIPDEGKLTYRGIDVNDIINACIAENRFGYEETAWLLMFGKLPTKEQLDLLKYFLAEARDLPENFAEDMILKAPSRDIMNKLARSVLAMYSFDENPDDNSLENIVRQSISLIACLPTIMTYAYQVKRRHFENKSMYFHPIDKSLSTSESILHALRPDCKFTDSEAKLLDLCMILHAEHGGGNNSTFACRVLSSSGTDTYSAIAAAIGALKGPRHGGANIKVVEMMDALKAEIGDVYDDEQVTAALRKVMNKELGDGSGLIYGMGHAVYTMSDPRAQILKENCVMLADAKGYSNDFHLLDAIERLSPALLGDKKGVRGSICANVDLYSGLVYRMLEIPPELYTPLFAVARMAGWCAHRMEEVATGGRIMRPAYRTALKTHEYIPLEAR